MIDADWPPASAWLDSNSSHPEVVVVGVPWDAGDGGHRTPDALRAVLGRFATFHSEADVELTGLPIRDAGDWVGAAGEIESRAGDLDAEAAHVFIGGDVALTRPVANGLGLGGLGLLAIDAYHRAAPADGAANKTVTSGLIADGLPSTHVAQIGPHGFSNPAAHRRFCDEQGVTVFPMDTVDMWGIEETVTVALDQLSRSCEQIHVAIDLSVLDTSFAPGARQARPGGLSPRQLATTALRSGRHPAVRTAGFTGVDVARDRGELTLLALATCFLSFAAGLAARLEVGP